MTIRVAASGGGPVPDTSALATDSELAAHAADTTNVHGVADMLSLGVGGGTPTVIDAGNLGASPSVDLTGETFVWHVGTLTAHANLDITGFEEGDRLELHYKQNATGGYTVTLDDGGTPLALDLPATPDARLKVEIEWVTDTEYRVEIPGSGGSGAGHTIVDETAELTARTKLTFVGPGVSARDDAANDQTIVELSAAGFAYPEDNNLKATSIPVAIADAGFQLDSQMNMFRLPVRKKVNVSKFLLAVTTQGSALTSAWIALYSNDLATKYAELTGLTAADATGWAATGPKSHTFAGGAVDLEPGVYRILMNAAGTTRPSMACKSPTANVSPNFNLVAADGFAAARHGSSSSATPPAGGAQVVTNFLGTSSIALIALA